MARVKFSEDVRPVSELKTKGSELVRQVSRTERPVVLTQHGRGVAVLLSVDQYEALVEDAEHAHIGQALDVAEREVASGQTISHDEVAAKWAKLLQDRADPRE